MRTNGVLKCVEMAGEGNITTSRAEAEREPLQRGPNEEIWDPWRRVTEAATAIIKVVGGEGFRDH